MPMSCSGNIWLLYIQFVSWNLPCCVSVSIYALDVKRGGQSLQAWGMVLGTGSLGSQELDPASPDAGAGFTAWVQCCAKPAIPRCDQAAKPANGCTAACELHRKVGVSTVVGTGWSLAYKPPVLTVGCELSPQARLVWWDTPAMLGLAHALGDDWVESLPAQRSLCSDLNISKGADFALVGISCVCFLNV